MNIVEKQLSDGYKQTVAGVVPEDWEVTTLEQAVHFLDGLRRPIKSGERAKIKGQYPYYGASGIVDYVNDFIFDGDFILLGEDGENILSRNLPLAFKASGKIWVNNHAHVMTPKDEFHIDYLVEYLESLDYSLLNSGTAQPKLNKKACLGINVVKPSWKEQTAIANALSDVDALLTELEKLIAKKQAIKTATMQQLLTGKTRLPQFATYTEGEKKGQPKGTKYSELGEIPEDWDILSIEDCSTKVGSGKTPTGGSSVYVDSGKPFVRSQNVGWGELRLTDLSFITEETHNTFKGSEIKLHDVLLNITGASIGRCALASEKLVSGNVNQHVCIIRVVNQKAHPYILQTLINSDVGQNQIESYQAGGNREGLNFSQVKNMKFPFPSDSEEQTAIATILSDMDSEIQTLEKRLAKTRQIKQGMMQELLTGRTRLPISKEAV